MKNPATFLERHDTLLLMFCSALFGLAWGLGYERGLIPNPWWFTPSLQRFCLILMGWTALLHSDPIQRLFWSITDFVALTLPFFAGLVFVPQMALPALIDYWVLLGKVSAAAVFGIAITQAIYSLLPGWRARMEKRTTTPAASENVEVAPDLTNVTVAKNAEPSSLREAKCCRSTVPTIPLNLPNNSSRFVLR